MNTEMQSVLKPVLRWTATKKYWLTVCIEKNEISFDAACSLHGISADELNRWISLCNEHGASALKSTRVQHYRQLAAV